MSWSIRWMKGRCGPTIFSTPAVTGGSTTAPTCSCWPKASTRPGWGYRANHFTVSVNQLSRFDSLEAVNQALKAQGFAINSAGGEIKGSPQALLEQSSTMADRADVRFSDRTATIPSCFYEFARRYPDADGTLYSGFVAASADRIFESTNAAA